MLFPGQVIHLVAQDRGNTSAQEYGDAVYRELEGLAGFFGYDYNHTAVFAGLDSGHNGKVLQALGSGYVTHEAYFYDQFTSYGTYYYGAYTLNNRTMTFTDRRSVTTTAINMVNAAIPYPDYLILPPVCIVYYGAGFDGSVADISNIRCDGFVEYCYEKNNFRVWRNQDYVDTAWSIVLYPDLNNDRPDNTRNPEDEASPWAQRGAPCATGPISGLGCSYYLPDTKMTTPAVIHLPIYQVTTNGGPGYLDVTIQATDESGIHFIGVVKPSEATWTYSPTQPQHPTSGSYSWTTRITNSGTLYYAAVDNGGNAPSAAQTPSVSLTVPPPDTAKPTVSISNPAANARLTNSAVITVRGTAADNWQVAAVIYQLNGGGWNTATGTTNWEATVMLVQGTNVFQVSSLDSSGNNSLTNTQNIILVLTAPIVVQTNGAGTVSPNYNGQFLELGKSYSMTATAGIGFMFTNWTGSVPTNSPTVTFVMAPDLVLTANFVDIQKPTVSITNPPPAKTYTNSQTATIWASALDNIGVASVEFYDGSILKGTDSTAAYTFDWSFTVADNGAHVWTARAYDAAGNVATSSAVTLTVSIDIAQPTVLISSPTNGSNLTISPTVVSGTASDPGSPSSGVNLVEVRVNGGGWQAGSGTASWSRSVTLSPCGNSIEARSRDNAGNYSEVTSNFVTYIPPNTVPNTPANVSPPNGQTGVALMPMLQATAFIDPDCIGDTHTASQWQMLNSAGTIVVAESGTDTVNKVSWVVPTNKLYYGSNYQWQVRYRDSRNGWSSNSAKTAFTTLGPSLSGTKQGTNIVFNWPTNALGFTLQWSTNLGTAIWSNATPAPANVSGQYTVTNSMTNNAKLYRLKKP